MKRIALVAIALVLALTAVAVGLSFKRTEVLYLRPDWGIPIAFTILERQGQYWIKAEGWGGKKIFGEHRWAWTCERKLTAKEAQRVPFLERAALRCIVEGEKSGHLLDLPYWAIGALRMNQYDHWFVQPPAYPRRSEGAIFWSLGYELLDLSGVRYGKEPNHTSQPTPSEGWRG